MAAENPNEEQSKSVNFNNTDEQSYDNSESRRLSKKRAPEKIAERSLQIRYFGHKRTYEKRSERSRPNPWRRYGALLKLHEIGGWVSKIGFLAISIPRCESVEEVASSVGLQLQMLMRMNTQEKLLPPLNSGQLLYNCSG
uniref:Uncharacterized protein n=1 Tax=Parascaris equorum TaxID=6256 RepID=A0A914RA56_PAREQ